MRKGHVRPVSGRTFLYREVPMIEDWARRAKRLRGGLHADKPCSHDRRVLMGEFHIPVVT